MPDKVSSVSTRYVFSFLLKIFKVGFFFFGGTSLVSSQSNDIRTKKCYLFKRKKKKKNSVETLSMPFISKA